MSPACRAPLSLIAPARRLMVIALGLLAGMTSAKNSCVSFEIPETGLRSVSPRARTPIKERSRARRMERRIAPKGMGGKT